MNERLQTMLRKLRLSGLANGPHAGSGDIYRIIGLEGSESRFIADPNSCAKR